MLALPWTNILKKFTKVDNCLRYSVIFFKRVFVVPDVHEFFLEIRENLFVRYAVLMKVLTANGYKIHGLKQKTVV